MNDLWTSVDPLGEALHFLRMSGVIYCRSEFTAPWGLALPSFKDCMMFHLVTSGGCWIEDKGAKAQPLRPGDLALVPHGRGHRLVSAPGARAGKLFDLPREEVSEHYEILRHGGGGKATHIISACVRFDHPAAQQLIALLPRLIRIETSRTPHMEWIQTMLRFLASEAGARRPGGETIITRLADILVIQTLRSWLEQDAAAQTGWLGALRDPQVGRVISLLNRDPARAWTVASLATEAGMSRSAFAARFHALVGEPPIRYLTRWRMHVAMASLKDNGTSLGELAARLGYQSEAAFSRAFKRCNGVSPGAARRTEVQPRV
jgi:AraC-like DNA-binding protein